MDQELHSALVHMVKTLLNIFSPIRFISKALWSVLVSELELLKTTVPLVRMCRLSKRN